MEMRVALATPLKRTCQCRAVNSCKFNYKQITSVSQSMSVKSFHNQACMFGHSIFYVFQMVARATLSKMTRQCFGHRQGTVVSLTISIWWSWKQSKSGNL